MIVNQNNPFAIVAEHRSFILPRQFSDVDLVEVLLSTFYFLLSSNSADPSFVMLFENLNVGKAGFSEKLAMFVRSKKVHVGREMLIENLLPNAFQMFSAFINLGHDQQ